MNIAFFVNDVTTEKPDFSTTRLALAAVRRGHDVWYLDANDLSYQPDEHLSARARCVPGNSVDSRNDLIAQAQSSEKPMQLVFDDLHVLMLRNDPADDFQTRSWAPPFGVIFGEMAAERGVLVLNDPRGLSRALNKLYFQDFPAEVRPRTLISRDRDELKVFLRDQGDKAVLKPLQGSGGAGVFLVRQDDDANINQMLDAVLRDGYAVAQEYLQEAAEGDTRILLMNGEPLRVEGTYAAFRRLRADDDMRSNMKVGATPEKAEVDAQILDICMRVRSKLLQDGMFLVGLDVVGDKLMEVNVFSPAGLGVEALTGVDFAPAIIEALEQKVHKAGEAGEGSMTNTRLATL
jgi:glutathione synthase